MNKPDSAKCGRKHDAKCLVVTNGFYGCSKSGHNIIDCPMHIAKGREGKKILLG